ncbi:hypothetical protein ADK41_11490 [Streptomyces caelestis]|uniref:Uncharacterized protein n=1 Tax=Streptomyces caelestis TaxID=36816 RepID=A0A0M9X9D3_9ACTN|nr:hypothetical protein ADK41_11490 [Streptomyces caelestis]
MQDGEAEDDRERGIEGGEDHRDGEHLPLGGEQVEDEPEGGARPDQQGLGAPPRRQPQESGAPDGAGEQDEDGGDPARDDRPQPARGIGLAQGDVLHGDAGTGQKPVRRLPAHAGAAAGHPPQGGSGDGDPRPGHDARAVAEEEDAAQDGQRDARDGAHRHDHAHRAVTQATVEEAHGGGAADAGQGAPEEVGAGEGVGGQEEGGPCGEQQAAEPAEEGDGGVRDAAGQQSAGGGGASLLERSRELGGRRCRSRGPRQVREGHPFGDGCPADGMVIPDRPKVVQAARAGCGRAEAHSWTRRWYSSRCSTLSVPPDRSHRARISSLTSSADRSEEGSTVVDMP